MMEMKAVRGDTTGDFTPGEFIVNGVRLGYTCEDIDRHLESGGVKIQNETAIPRGRYKVILSYSNHFQRTMPEILDVPGYSGVRIHGGNTAADTEGCILLGSAKTETGVANCLSVNSALSKMIGVAQDRGEECFLEVL